MMTYTLTAYACTFAFSLVAMWIFARGGRAWAWYWSMTLLVSGMVLLPLVWTAGVNFGGIK